MKNNRWSNSFLDNMRQQGDSLADNVLDSLEAHGEVEFVNRLLEHLDKNNSPLSPNFPKELADYLQSTQQLPDWADKNKIALAQNYFSSRGAVFGVVLLCGSLPVLYAGGMGGAQILAATGQLTNHYERRAGETLRFILNAMEPGGLSENGSGIRTIQKVRLMHAAIRYYARRNPSAWPARPAWGAPINQEELVGTLLAFSSQALQGLEKMGVSVSVEEKDAYFHCWKVIGHLLGIQTQLLPEDIADAELLWNSIAARNFIPSDAGKQLAKAHLRFLKHVIPGELCDGIAISLMRYLMGRDIAEKDLGLPKPGWTYLLIDFLRSLFGLKEILMDSSRTLQEILEKESIHFVEGLARHWMHDDSTPFRIPPSLTQK